MSTYIPARLVVGSRWYIIYYQVNPDTGERERFRETYDLNRIKNKKDRKVRALQIIDEINTKLVYGYPYLKMESERKETPLYKAIELARDIKCQSDRKRTRDMYRSMCNLFLAWAKVDGLLEMPIGKFNSEHALNFMDHVIMDRKVGARTYNNNLLQMKALINELIARNYIDKNPFQFIKKKKETDKIRRAFSNMEKQAIAEHLYKNDRVLFFCVILQYYCFIRPAEMRRLQFQDIKLSKGVVTLPGIITKNHKNGMVTIPDVMMPLLADCLSAFSNTPVHYLIFGEGVKPHPNKECGHNTLNWRHTKVMEFLFKTGKIGEYTGLSLYSWKDTGVQDVMDQQVNLWELMMQLRHSNLETTQKYADKHMKVNHQIKLKAKSLIRL